MPSLVPVTEARAARRGLALDLNDSSLPPLVREVPEGAQRVSVEVVVESGSWGSAVVELKRGISGRGWDSLTGTVALTGAGFIWDQDIGACRQLALDVTTLAGTACSCTAYFAFDGGPLAVDVDVTVDEGLLGGGGLF